MADIIRQFTRLIVEYGDAKVATPAQQKLLEAQWFETFSAYSPVLLHRAVTKCIEDCPHWPKVAEVLTNLRELRAEVVEKWHRTPGFGSYRAADQNDPPPPTPEALARVSKMVAEFKLRAEA